MDQVWAGIQARTQYLLDGLQAIADVEILSDLRAERRSGIVTFRLRDGDTEALFQRLVAAQVLCAPRGGGIRLSPHYYTPLAQLDTVLAMIRG
jgi:selenocysteine lyase/cysteine desulfurase